MLASRTASAQRSVAERAAAASTAAATSVAASQSRSSPRAGERASCDRSSRGVADRRHLGRPSRLRRAASLGLPEVALPSARKLSTCEAAAFSSEDGPGWRRRGAECRGAARGASADWVKNPQEIGNEEFQSRLTKHHVLTQSRCGRGGGAARAGGGRGSRGARASPAKLIAAGRTQGEREVHVETHAAALVCIQWSKTYPGKNTKYTDIDILILGDMFIPRL